MTQEYDHIEQEKLRLLREGDVQAFSAIYLEYSKDLYRWAFNILKDTDACEDILQDVFLTLWQNRERVVITTSLRGYLFVAIRNRVYTHISSNRARASVFERLEERIWGPPLPDNILHQKELQARLTNIIRELPDRSRQVYELSREQQLTNREIAEQLGITVKGVEFHITTALKKIRQSFPELLPLLLIFLAKK